MFNASNTFIHMYRTFTREAKVLYNCTVEASVCRSATGLSTEEKTSSYLEVKSVATAQRKKTGAAFIVCDM